MSSACVHLHMRRMGHTSHLAAHSSSHPDGKSTTEVVQLGFANRSNETYLTATSHASGQRTFPTNSTMHLTGLGSVRQPKKTGENST